MLVIEGEDGDIDLRHDRAKEGGRFESSETLLAKKFGELVDLEHELAESIVRRSTANTDREVTLAESGLHVGECLQGANDGGTAAGSEREPGSDNDDGDGPADVVGEISGP